MEKPVETAVQHLLRSIRVTASARFVASRRLRLHEDFSLWTISLSSVLLIILPMLKPLGIRVSVYEGLLSLAQIAAAAVVLVASILVSASKFGERADRMHRCGLELNSLAKQLHITSENNPNATQLRRAEAQYASILAMYENHTDTDFSKARVAKFAHFYNVTWLDRLLASLRFAAVFLLYPLVLSLELLFVYLLLFAP